MKRKVIYAILALLVSFGLWMYVVTVENPEFEGTFYNIPVVLENEEILRERGLMITSDKVPTVTLKLSGNRADVNKLDESNITIVADLSKIYSSGEQKLNYQIIYPGNVPSNSIEIVHQSPSQISLPIAQWKSGDVEVKVEYSGAVPEQFIAFKENAVLDYPRINVTGPASVIDQISTAVIHVDLEGKTETISQSYAYTFCDKDGNPVQSDRLKTDVEQVRFTMKIQRWKDIELKLNIIGGGGIDAEDCKITLDTPTIRVSGSEQVLERLDSLVLGEIKLGEQLTDFEGTFNIEMPEGVTNLSEKTKVNVTVELPDLQIREFTVTDIRAINIPDGLKVSIINLEKTVRVRGPRELIEQMTAEDIFIEVDFSKAEVGTAPVKAAVQFTDQYALRVGLMGSCDINATVTQS